MDVDTEELIAEVYTKPNLWDSTRKDYRNRNLRVAAWTEICHKLIPNFQGFDQDTKIRITAKIQTRWKTARDAYMKSKRKMSVTSSDWKTSKYQYFDHLHFLDRVEEWESDGGKVGLEGGVVGGLEVVGGLVGIKSEPMVMEENLAAVHSVEESAVFPDPLPYSMDCSGGSRAPVTCEGHENRLIHFLLESQRRNEDEDYAFVTSLLPTLRTFNLDQKLEFRVQLLQLLQKIKSS